MADPLPQILRMPSVLKLTGLSRVTIWRLTKTGSFPAPVRLSKRAVGWRSDDVEEWVRSRPAA